MCDQVAERFLLFIAEDSVGLEAQAIRQAQLRATRELPQLRKLVPVAGAAPATVLEEEKWKTMRGDAIKYIYIYNIYICYIICICICI